MGLREWVALAVGCLAVGVLFAVYWTFVLAPASCGFVSSWSCPPPFFEQPLFEFGVGLLLVGCLILAVVISRWLAEGRGARSGGQPPAASNSHT